MQLQKKHASQLKKPQQDTHKRVEDGSRKDEKKDNNNISETIYMGILHYLKFEYSPRYKTVCNYTMSYLVALMITTPEFLKNSKNNQINQGLEHKPIILDKTMIKI